MTNSQFKIKQEYFEGPLDLLLNLIEKRKLHISDVTLVQVVDDYLAYIQQSDNMPISESAQFILIASTLTLIKSKSLLPKLDLTTEEQADINDLEQRLKEYQKYKNLSIHIQQLFDKQPMFISQKQVQIEPIFSPEKDLDTTNITEAINRVLLNIPKPEKMSKTIVQKVISLEEVIDKLTQRITQSLKMSFRDFSGQKNGQVLSKEEKINVVISFLAMLELVKDEIISVAQHQQYADIEIETQNVGVPQY